MALSPSRYSVQSQLTDSPEAAKNTMSLAVQNPPQMPKSPWERRMGLPSRTRSPPQRVELPSIRAMLPDIGLGPRDEGRTDVSPTFAVTTRQPQPEFPRSPVSHKRRRLSSEEDIEAEQRDATIPRLERLGSTRGTQRSQSTVLSPRSSDRRASTFSDSWTLQQQRTSPYTSSNFVSGTQTQSAYENAPRPVLPSLQGLTRPAAMPRPRSSNEYALDSSRSAQAQIFPQFSHFDPPVSYHHPDTAFLSYGYQQPRGQSYSGPSSCALSHDRTPFTANVHHGYAQSGYGYGDSGESDAKQRKRRGNLPKETTDKLRSWFVAHLQHPYPTEDEKQDLMRQTGLQMNQISNWFINARRRQLPAMINNARAESDARARPGPGDASEYRDEERGRGGSRDSDGDRSPYDEMEDEYETRRMALGMGVPKRGSF